MKALVYVGEKQLELQNIPEPEGEFLVRVLGCAICGTDLKTYLHGHPYFKPPTILGHEFYGVVDKAPRRPERRQRRRTGRLPCRAGRGPDPCRR